MRPTRVIPTVDCYSPAKVEEILSHFKNLKEESKDTSLFGSLKQTIVSFFKRGPPKTEPKQLLENPTEKKSIKIPDDMPPLIDLVDLSQDDEVWGMNSEPQEYDFASDCSVDFGSPKSSQSSRVSQSPPMALDLEALEDFVIDFDNPDPQMASQQQWILKKIEENKNGKSTPSQTKRPRNESNANTSSKKIKTNQKPNSKTSTSKRSCNISSSQAIQSPSSSQLKQASVMSFFSPKS